MGSKNRYHIELSRLKAGDRNFVLCIDGTWNDPTDATESGSGTTNVLRLFKAVSRDESKQYARYFPGVGNEVQNGWFGRLFGGAFGWGADRLRDEAYAVLVTNWRPGDRIFIFGFSRGAAIARMLANLIHKEGIPQSITVTKDDEGRIVEYKNRGRKQVNLKVEMLGVWDTVASFGIPVNVLGVKFHEINLFKDFTIAPNIRHAYHLLAVDERRDAFKPTLMNHSRRGIDEIWFPGVHSDVGGGFDRRRLADITLKFMVDRAQELGLVFHPDSLEEIAPNPKGLGVLHQKDRWGDLMLSNRRIKVLANNKPVRSKPAKVHESVLGRMQERRGDYDPPPIKGLKSFFDVVGDDGKVKKRVRR